MTIFDKLLMAGIAIGLIIAAVAMLFPSPPFMSYLSEEQFKVYCSRPYSLGTVGNAPYPGCGPQQNEWVIRGIIIALAMAAILMIKNMKKSVIGDIKEA